MIFLVCSAPRVSCLAYVGKKHSPSFICHSFCVCSTCHAVPTLLLQSGNFFSCMYRSFVPRFRFFFFFHKRTWGSFVEEDSLLLLHYYCCCCCCSSSSNSFELVTKSIPSHSHSLSDSSDLLIDLLCQRMSEQGQNKSRPELGEDFLSDSAHFPAVCY